MSTTHHRRRQRPRGYTEPYVPPSPFGVLLRTMRKRHNLNQGGLAELLDVNHSYISRLERGDRRPSLGCCVRLADVFALDPSERIWLISAAGFQIYPELGGSVVGMRASDV